MNVLLDASLPPRFARALDILMQPGHKVSHVRDILGNDATDQHITDHLRENPETIVVGIDLDITDHPHRIEALRQWQRPVFLLTAGWLEESAWDQAWMLTSRMNDILKKAGAAGEAYIFIVPSTPGGRIRKVA